MKRVVLVLELSGDEAELDESAVSETKVGFGGLTLTELLQLGARGFPAAPDGVELSHAISEGAVYLGGKSLRLDNLFG